MTIKKVLLLGDQRLRKQSAPVENWGSPLQKIKIDLADTLGFLQEKYGLGRALAAPQIGCLQQAIYYNSGQEQIFMINPCIIEKSRDKFPVWDSCYSFKVAFFVRVFRHRRIKVRYWDELGQEKETEFTDNLAELFQHEIDHLQGCLATDYLEDNKEIIMREEWEKLKKD